MSIFSSCAFFGNIQQAPPQTACLPAKLLPHAVMRKRRGGQSTFLHAATELNMNIL